RGCHLGNLSLCLGDCGRGIGWSFWLGSRNFFLKLFLGFLLLVRGQKIRLACFLLCTYSTGLAFQSLQFLSDLSRARQGFVGHFGPGQLLLFTTKGFDNCRCFLFCKLWIISNDFGRYWFPFTNRLLYIMLVQSRIL